MLFSFLHEEQYKGNLKRIRISKVRYNHFEESEKITNK